MFILLDACVISLQPPSDGELSVTSGILGRLHKWKNESTVSSLIPYLFYFHFCCRSDDSKWISWQRHEPCVSCGVTSEWFAFCKRRKNKWRPADLFPNGFQQIRQIMQMENVNLASWADDLILIYISAKIQRLISVNAFLFQSIPSTHWKEVIQFPLHRFVTFMAKKVNKNLPTKNDTAFNASATVANRRKIEKSKWSWDDAQRNRTYSNLIPVCNRNLLLRCRHMRHFNPNSYFFFARWLILCIKALLLSSRCADSGIMMRLHFLQHSPTCLLILNHCIANEWVKKRNRIEN